MDHRQPTLSVDILVVRGRQVLLGLLAKDWWINDKPTYGFPGREIEFGESFSKAIRRNILEEVGCVVVSHSIISINANYALDNHFVGIGAIAHIKGEPKLLKPEDWQKWGWVDIDDVPTNLFPPAYNLMQSYLQKKITVSD